MMTGLGLISGPIIGSTLFSVLGFRRMFFVYGGFEVLLGTIVRLGLPDREVHILNVKEVEDDKLLKAPD